MMILAATGHRPPALGGYSPTVTTRAVRLARAFLTIWQPDLVLSGMAIGWDQAVAHAAHALGIPFRAYLPGTWQADAWPPASQSHYRTLLGLAAEVRVASDRGYEPAAMQVRNMMLVDDCDLLVALWNGSPGGTANCIDYALRRRAVPRAMVNLWSLWS